MKFNKWFMYIWWGVLILCDVVLLHSRFASIKEGAITAFDTIVIAVFVILVLIPFFSEISFLGLTIKKDIAELKKDVKEEIKDIRQYVANNVDNKFNASLSFGQSMAPPPDEQLDELEGRIKVIMRDVLTEKGITKAPALAGDFDVPEKTRVLFSARYLLEKELRRIWKSRFAPGEDTKRLYPLHNMIYILVDNKIIPSSLGGIIRDVYSICTPAIHGDDPTDIQIEFVKEVAPVIIGALKEIV